MDPHNWGWYNIHTLDQFNVLIYQQKPRAIAKLQRAFNKLNWVKMGRWFFDKAGPAHAWESTPQANLINLSEFVEYISENCDRANYGTYIITDDTDSSKILMMVRQSKANVHNLINELKLAFHPTKRPFEPALRCMRHVKVHPLWKEKRFYIGTAANCIPLYQVEGVFTEKELSILAGTDQQVEPPLKKPKAHASAFVDAL